MTLDSFMFFAYDFSQMIIKQGVTNERYKVHYNL